MRSVRLTNAFINLSNQGFTTEESRQILLNTPSIFGKSIDTVTRQVALYGEIFGDGYKEVIMRNPRRFIQGYNKTRERYNILINIEDRQDLNMEDVFLPEKLFIRNVSKYGSKGKFPSK